MNYINVTYNNFSITKRLLTDGNFGAHSSKYLSVKIKLQLIDLAASGIEIEIRARGQFKDGLIWNLNRTHFAYLFPLL